MVKYKKYNYSNSLDSENAAHLLNLTRYFEGVWNVNILTKESKLLLNVIKGEHMSIKEGIILTDCSYRGFYMLLDRMVAKQLIEIVPDKSDRRVKRIKLTEKAAGDLLQNKGL